MVGLFSENRELTEALETDLSETVNYSRPEINVARMERIDQAFGQYVNDKFAFIKDPIMYMLEVRTRQEGKGMAFITQNEITKVHRMIIFVDSNEIYETNSFTPNPTFSNSLGAHRTYEKAHVVQCGDESFVLCRDENTNWRTFSNRSALPDPSYQHGVIVFRKRDAPHAARFSRLNTYALVSMADVH